MVGVSASRSGSEVKPSRLELHSLRSRRVAVCAAIVSLSVCYGVVLAHMGSRPNAIVGGLYSNIDGSWAEWSAMSILHFGAPFDLSPFNLFSGTGSMYLPNRVGMMPRRR